MFHRVLDVCENQTMPMTLAQDRHLLNDRSMQVMFWYSRQKGQTNWQLYIWFHIGWNKNRSRCKVQPPFYHIFPPTSTSPPSPGGPARLLIFVDFSGIIPGEGGKVSSVKFAQTFRPVSGSLSKNFSTKTFPPTNVHQKCICQLWWQWYVWGRDPLATFRASIIPKLSQFHFDLSSSQILISIIRFFPLISPNSYKVVTFPSNFCPLATSRSNWIENITIQNVWQFSPPGTFLFGHLGLFRVVKITCVPWSIIYANYQNTR